MDTQESTGPDDAKKHTAETMEHDGDETEDKKQKNEESKEDKAEKNKEVSNPMML